MLRPRVRLQSPSRVTIQQPGSWHAAGAKTADRGYGAEWQKARIEHLRKHPFCAMCEKEGLYRAGRNVDHKIPHRGDQKLFWDRSNWQTLCDTHHNRDKQRLENAAMESKLP